jgi:hypothetical protein
MPGVAFYGGPVFHHVAVFTFADGTTDDAKREVIDALRGLPAQIPEIAMYAVGLDAGVNQGNHDLAVVATFEDQAAYLVYRDHPVHRRVIVERVQPVVAGRAAVQFTT